MDVGIRELKQHLSEYLERAERGEVIRVTDRGRPKALISPIVSDRLVERGIAAGWLSQGNDAPVAPVRRARAKKHVMELLREDRDGR